MEWCAKVNKLSKIHGSFQKKIQLPNDPAIIFLSDYRRKKGVFKKKSFITLNGPKQ